MSSAHVTVVLFVSLLYQWPLPTTDSHSTAVCGHAVGVLTAKLINPDQVYYYKL